MASTVRLWSARQAPLLCSSRPRSLAAELGFELDEAFHRRRLRWQLLPLLSECPTAPLDGMGAVGEGAHAPHENVVVEHLVPRTALLAALLATVS